MTSQSKQLTLWKPPGIMTEREVRTAGLTSNRLCTFRGMLRQGIEGSTLSIKTRGGGTVAMPMSSIDTEALIGLLKERDETFLIALNIELEA